MATGIGLSNQIYSFDILQSSMNQSNDHYQQQILLNILIPLQFTIVLPHTDTNSNPNYSISNPTYVNRLLSFGVPHSSSSNQGLAAAKQLMSFGYEVTVLEGRKRHGDLVYTKKTEGGTRVAAADFGGTVLTGTNGNPLGILVRQLSYHLHKIQDKCPLYRLNGQPVDSGINEKVDFVFNQLLDKTSKLRQLAGEVCQDVSLAAFSFRDVLAGRWRACESKRSEFVDCHLTNLEFANMGFSVSLKAISLLGSRLPV